MIEHFLKISKIENYGIKDFDLEKCAKSGYKIANRKKDEVERKLDEYVRFCEKDEDFGEG